MQLLCVVSVCSYTTIIIFILAVSWNKNLSRNIVMKMYEVDHGHNSQIQNAHDLTARIHLFKLFSQCIVSGI